MKLGGAVLTDKSRYRTPRLDAIGRLASELAASPGPLVVVHGAGSYGHVVARTHALSRGIADAAEPDQDARREAFARVHGDVRELDGLVLAALREAGVRAVSHAAFDLCRTTGGVLSHLDLSPVERTLDRGFTPVLFGDGVLDEAQAFAILSGDVLVEQVALAMEPTRVVFATSVDGVLDGDRLVPRLAGDATPSYAPPPGADVTGGMAGKIEKARRIAATGVDVRIVNGLAPGRVREALDGKDVVGTKVMPA